MVTTCPECGVAECGGGAMSEGKRENDALWIAGEMIVQKQIAEGKVQRGYDTVEELFAALDSREPSDE